MDRSLITNTEADAHFGVQAKALGLDPDSTWVGGSVPMAAEEIRHILAAYAGETEGQRLLEFGCNYGASAIVAAKMGATVAAIDVDDEAIALAQLNAERYGADAAVDFRHLPHSRHIPFPDESFDIILAISVLEYVRREELANILLELRRLLRPGGLLLVSGTASRLALREVQTGRWFVNYWPRWVDRKLPGRTSEFQRGLNPLRLIRAFADFENLDLADKGSRWCAARARRWGNRL
ncbi:class I SAM-dependent methyltransferase [Sphingopyxis sp. R3-92]|uniref:class I SAM-dependent methyltransferase n=1 Tax=Sphingopyxis sp. R3-92 TaxID=3158553 RepID=UPI003EE4BB8E